MQTNKQSIISVLVPAYNYPSYTRDCLESIFAQEGFEDWDIEVIMTDDCGRDDLSEVAKPFQQKYPHFQYHKNEKNLGMVSNWNKLLDMKKAKYYMFVSNDDMLYDKNALRFLWDKMNEYKLDVVYGKYICFNDQSERFPFQAHIKIWDQEIFYDSFEREIRNHSISFGGILYKDYGFRYKEKAGFWADWCMNLEYLSRAKKVALLGKSIFLYRSHINQVIQNFSLIQFIKTHGFIRWYYINNIWILTYINLMTRTYISSIMMYYHKIFKK
jgi:glycosyltransferase involved in cell wall biosynthesis